MNANSAEVKAALMASTAKLKLGIKEMHSLLLTSTPMAKQLSVMKDVEKFERQLERIEMQFRELPI